MADAGYHCREQIVLVLGVTVQRHDGDIGLRGDNLHADTAIALPQESITRGIQDRRTLSRHQLCLGMIGRPVSHRN